MTRTYYSLLGIEPTADLDTIKKAFRREIARYHPDKVAHLGQEFQEMAAGRASELTVAYTTLANERARADYDAGLEVPSPAPPAAPPRPAPAPAAPQSRPSGQNGSSWQRNFETHRAGRNDIMRRAILDRIRAVAVQEIGACDLPVVTGFDGAFLARGSGLLRRSNPLSVLVKLVDVVDGAALSKALADLARSGFSGKPLAMLLIGDALGPIGELARAVEDYRRKNPAAADVVFPIPVSLRDWAAKVPANAPASIVSLVAKLRDFRGEARA